MSEISSLNLAAAVTHPLNNPPPSPTLSVGGALSNTTKQTSLHLPGCADHRWAFGIYGLLPHTDAPTLSLGQGLKTIYQWGNVA